MKKPSNKKIVQEVWNHHDLIESLVDHFNTMMGFVCSEVTPGSTWFSRYSVPDVMRVRKSYANWDVQIYEIKVGRADFQSDIRTSKWKSYLESSSRFYFATPSEGVVRDKDEIPEGVGWIVRGKKGWSTRKTPKIRDFKPDVDMLLALLMSVDNKFQRMSGELDADKKLKHSHNVIRNQLMHNRLYKVEEEIKRRREQQLEFRSVRDQIQKILGVKIDHWDWEKSFAKVLKDIRRGVPVSLLESVGKLDIAVGNVKHDIKNFQTEVIHHSKKGAKSG